VLGDQHHGGVAAGFKAHGITKDQLAAIDALHGQDPAAHALAPAAAGRQELRRRALRTDDDAAAATESAAATAAAPMSVSVDASAALFRTSAGTDHSHTALRALAKGCRVDEVASPDDLIGDEHAGFLQ